MCTVFLVLSILSKNIPGYFLAYIILMLIFSGPLAISKLPNECKNRIASTVQLLNNNEGNAKLYDNTLQFIIRFPTLL